MAEQLQTLQTEQLTSCCYVAKTTQELRCARATAAVVKPVTITRVTMITDRAGPPPAARPKRPGTPRHIMIIRQHWARIIALTPIECRRCHRPITATQQWQLGHPENYPYAAGNIDHDLKPEHKHCNQSGLTTNRPATFTW